MSGTAKGHGDPVEQRLAVTDDIGEAEAVVRLVGELDHDTAGALRASLARCEAAGSTRILVDGSRLEFCDSTGLNVLLDARTRAQARGAAVALVGLTRGVSRVFEVTGASALFPRYASVAEARSDGPRPGRDGD